MLGAQQPRRLVDHHEQRLVLGEPDQEAQRGFPIAEGSGQQVVDSGAELFAHPFRQPGELPLRAVLTGGGEEHGPLTFGEVRQ